MGVGAAGVARPKNRSWLTSCEYGLSRNCIGADAGPRGMRWRRPPGKPRDRQIEATQKKCTGLHLPTKTAIETP